MLMVSFKKKEMLMEEMRKDIKKKKLETVG
jgi:hypothetical protein